MKRVEKVLYKNGETDILNYYSRISPLLEKFLKGKKIAAKIHLKDFYFIKRGNKLKPLYVEYFKQVDENMLKLRKFHLKQVREKLTKKQELIWDYFPPRKLVQFFYATNDEGIKKPIERIFIDIDRKNLSSEQAQKVCLNLLEEIKKDEKFNKLLKYKIFLMWTGSSFHVYLLLNKKINSEFYKKYLSYSNKKEYNFLNKWAEDIEKKTKIKVEVGHKKEKDMIILDSNNTPSGKLARTPFSLHLKNYKEIDGVAVPITENELKDKNLVKKLKKLTPEKIIKNLDYYKEIMNSV